MPILATDQLQPLPDPAANFVLQRSIDELTEAENSIEALDTLIRTCIARGYLKTERPRVAQLQKIKIKMIAFAINLNHELAVAYLSANLASSEQLILEYLEIALDYSSKAICLHQNCPAKDLDGNPAQLKPLADLRKITCKILQLLIFEYKTAASFF